LCAPKDMGQSSCPIMDRLPSSARKGLTRGHSLHALKGGKLMRSFIENCVARSASLSAKPAGRPLAQCATSPL
jgi:hypothetical protein